MISEYGDNWLPTIDPEKLKNLLVNAIQALDEAVIVDEEGSIVYASDSYVENMELTDQNILGKPIQEVLDFSEIPMVLKTGRATKAMVYYRNGKEFLISRYPIRSNGKIIGVLAQCILGNNMHFDKIQKKLRTMSRELQYYKEKYQQISTQPYTVDSIITASPPMKYLKEIVVQIATTSSTVLLTGESGTGKEVFATAIHNLSNRKNKPFIRLNCAAIPENLIEAELFGYEEGAFTGAIKGGKIGDFEAADGGTLLLDEVDSLSPPMQAKLLRAIQGKAVRKVGSTRETPVDVRFIFATNKDLLAMVQQGTFREDFYYRINVVNLKLPPLRERPEDVPYLVRYFIKKFNCDMGMKIGGITPEAMTLLQSYSWPGNVRELENRIERAFNYTHGGGMLTPDHFKFDYAVAEPVSLTLRGARAKAERRAILRALDLTGGNKKEAAALLEIDRSVLYAKLKQYEIDSCEETG